MTLGMTLGYVILAVPSNFIDLPSTSSPPLSTAFLIGIDSTPPVEKARWCGGAVVCQHGIAALQRHVPALSMRMALKAIVGDSARGDHRSRQRARNRPRARCQWIRSLRRGGDESGNNGPCLGVGGCCCGPFWNSTWKCAADHWRGQVDHLAIRSICRVAVHADFTLGTEPGLAGPPPECSRVGIRTPRFACPKGLGQDR